MRIASLFAASFLLAGHACQADKPNVVLIVTDDAGWADYGFMRDADPNADPGNRGAVPTPHLDRLAGMGVTFTNAYTASVCSPSRAMITTGQYGTRFGYGSNIQGDLTAINNASYVQGLPTSAVTVWERMQTVGYDTAAVGKWHIGQHANGGGQLGNRPENQGVEHFDGLWGGSRGYFAGSATGTQALRRTISDGAGSISSTSVVESQYNGEYVTDVFGDQSVDYIRDKATNDADPFFLYTSFTAPHTPMQATASDLAFIDSLNEPGFTGQRRTYAAMQYSMDRNVGKILDALDDPNNDGDTSDSIADDTMLLFINDNGGDCCDSGPNSSDNGELRNGKGSQFEGGMRVPMIVAGAGVNAGVQGTVSTDLVHAIDLVPTAYSGAGEGAFGPSDVVDGKNLLPYINGTLPGVAHEDLFISRYNNQQSAVRKGKWKYMHQNGTGFQLYDLDNDLDESNNVVGSLANAAVVEELHQLMAGYQVQMDKPRHDNQAPLTNQFDHFRFRENAVTNGAFSSANAWVDGDNPGGSVTASWRDGYADNRMTFRAKSSGDYTVTNDLKGAGGLAYMANRLTLASADAPLVGERSATIAGLPLMMTASRAGAAPVIDLDALDATPGAFTFNVDADIEVYDDLTLQGNGNQRFVFGGQVREFRPGRSVTKAGSADVTFAGGVDLSGTLDLQGGAVAFTNGSVRGHVLARTGVAVRVGPEGIVPGEGGSGDDPLEIVTTDLELNYDAALDLSGDSLWSDAAGSPDNLSFGSAATTTPVDTATFPHLSAAYTIPTSGGAEGLNNYFEQSGPRSRQDATFEVVFNVTNSSAGADQVLLEAGGAARGVAMVLNDGQLTFNVDGDASDINLTTGVTEGWNHAVGVIDLESGTDSVALYLNNQLVGQLSGQTIDDWAGGNVFGLGEGASSVTGVSSGTGSPFHGEIAVARFYGGTAFGTTEVDQNHQWLLQDIAPSTGQPAVTLAIDGDFTLEAGSSLALDLLTTDESDRVEASGLVALAGDLIVAASDGFDPAAGDRFDIASGSARSGKFDSYDLPGLVSGLMWQVNYAADRVQLLVTLAGDYNGDGLVDAGDYTVWRDAEGQAVDAGVGGDGDGDGQVTQADYLIWRDNYGASVPALVEATAVPEPAALTATALGWLIAYARTWR
ncbi:Arylsulfatase [Planctomycetes bacterium MalM25]|nr:Arylsulfatase [Planctomycetes bacterium MalM25]